MLFLSGIGDNFVFILDVTNKSINSGAVNTFIESLRYIINNHYLSLFQFQLYIVKYFVYLFFVLLKIKGGDTLFIS